MHKNLLTIVAATVGLAACTAVPEIVPEHAVAVTDVVQSIRCELSDLGKLPIVASEKLGWTAGVNLKLVTLNDASLGASATLNSPLFPGSLVATIGGTYQGTAQSTSVVEFQEAVTANLPKCNREGLIAQTGGLHGDLGIARWFGDMQATVTSTDIKPTKLTYTIEFVVSISGNLKPTLMALPLRASFVDGGITLASSRKRTHTLTLALSKKEAPSTLEVVVVGTKPKKKGATSTEPDKNNLEILDRTIQSQSPRS